MAQQPSDAPTGAPSTPYDFAVSIVESWVEDPSSSMGQLRKRVRDAIQSQRQADVLVRATDHHDWKERLQLMGLPEASIQNISFAVEQAAREWGQGQADRLPSDSEAPTRESMRMTPRQAGGGSSLGTIAVGGLLLGGAWLAYRRWGDQLPEELQ